MKSKKFLIPTSITIVVGIIIGVSIAQEVSNKNIRKEPAISEELPKEETDPVETPEEVVDPIETPEEPVETPSEPIEISREESKVIYDKAYAYTTNHFENFDSFTYTNDFNYNTYGKCFDTNDNELTHEQFNLKFEGNDADYDMYFEPDDSFETIKYVNDATQKKTLIEDVLKDNKDVKPYEQIDYYFEKDNKEYYLKGSCNEDEPMEYNAQENSVGHRNYMQYDLINEKVGPYTVAYYPINGTNSNNRYTNIYSGNLDEYIDHLKYIFSGILEENLFLPTSEDYTVLEDYTKVDNLYTIKVTISQTGKNGDNDLNSKLVSEVVFDEQNIKSSVTTFNIVETIKINQGNDVFTIKKFHDYNETYYLDFVAKDLQILTDTTLEKVNNIDDFALPIELQDIYFSNVLDINNLTILTGTDKVDFPESEKINLPNTTVKIYEDKQCTKEVQFEDIKRTSYEQSFYYKPQPKENYALVIVSTFINNKKDPNFQKEAKYREIDVRTNSDYVLPHISDYDEFPLAWSNLYKNKTPDKVTVNGVEVNPNETIKLEEGVVYNIVYNY